MFQVLRSKFCKDDVDRKNVRKRTRLRTFVENSQELEIAIEIKDLKLTIGNDEILENLNLPLYKNKLTLLIGNNGSGKSTLLSVLTG